MSVDAARTAGKAVALPGLAGVAQENDSERKCSDTTASREDAQQTDPDTSVKIKTEDADDSDDSDDWEDVTDDDEGNDDEEKDQAALFKLHGIDVASYTIDGPGPHTFFSWDEAIEAIMGTDAYERRPVLHHKQSALDAFAPVAKMPRDERDEAMHDFLDAVQSWAVSVHKKARRTEEAKMLIALWKKRGSAEKEDGEVKEDGKVEEDDGEGDEDSDAPGWWYEMYAQRDKPAAGTPALEVSFEDDGTLWLTGFKEADLRARRAMSFICTFFN